MQFESGPLGDYPHRLLTLALNAFDFGHHCGYGMNIEVDQALLMALGLISPVVVDMA